MTDYEVAPWVAVIVIGFTIWRAFHGPYSDQWWRSTADWLRSVTRR